MKHLRETIHNASNSVRMLVVLWGVVTCTGLARFRGRLQLTVLNGKPIYPLVIIQKTDGALLSVATVVEP